MERKGGKCWKLPIFEGKLRVFISYLSEIKTGAVCSITLLYSSAFYRLFLPFFVLEIFKFKYDTFFIRNSAAISKFDWFEQPYFKVVCRVQIWKKNILFCIYKKLIILSLFNIETLNFTMYILKTFTCSLKAYVLRYLI